MEEFVLVVDDESAVRQLMLSQLSFLGFAARATGEGEEALSIAGGDEPPALVLLDIEMPGLSGLELLRRIKQIDRDVQVVMVSGLHDLGIVRECLRAGAYDYLAKPFELEDLHNTAERALERRHLVIQNREYREGLERRVEEKTEEIRHTRDMALLTLAKLAEARDDETGKHLERMQEYSRILGEGLRDGPYAEQVAGNFIEQVFKTSPLHDIGKVAIPDAILRKPGPLSVEEREVMREHTTIGGKTLEAVIEQFSGPTFLTMAMEIAYYHHERWDGTGYPFAVGSTDIPLAARIVALADAYDAITSRRPYKEPKSHREAVRRILIDRGRHFDPVLVDTFIKCKDEFATIQRRLSDQQPTLESTGSTP